MSRRHYLTLAALAVAVTALGGCEMMRDIAGKLPGGGDSQPQGQQSQQESAPQVVEIGKDTPQQGLPQDQAVLPGEVAGQDLSVLSDEQRQRAEAEAQALLLEAQAQEAQAAVATLPDYASGSKPAATAAKTCATEIGDAHAGALSLSKQIASKLKVEPGMIYVSPTVIPDAYADCVDDVSSEVKQGLATNSSFQIASDQYDQIGSAVSQNSGSSAVVPLMVRAARQAGVPYLAVPSVHRVSDDVRLTIRVVKVQNGITLHQNWRKL